uniref:fructose-bisphosphatase n=1 Tax=Tetraselmis sp. GSL018 TaxID=582737 RepID=A0A061SCI7_9CHLO
MAGTVLSCKTSAVLSRALARQQGRSSTSQRVNQLRPSSTARTCSGFRFSKLVCEARSDPSVNAVAVEEKSEAAAAEGEIMTFSTWLLKEEAKGNIDSELAVVLSSISLACKRIASLVMRAGLADMTGLAGETNVQGEDQKKLDVISNNIFRSCLKSSGRTGIIASEEEDVPVAVEETYSGNYIVVFDPLDGSSNIDAAVSTGSIFGIYDADEECSIEDMDDPDTIMNKCVIGACKPGSSLLSAGYCMYSSSVILVLTIGRGVFGFTLDPTVGEFILSHDNLKVPESGKIYSFNEGNYKLWDERLQRYMDSLKDPELWGGKPYSARYIGSLVGDFHRTLLYGGLYGYPGDKKNPNGKLRLLYECAPMSFIMEQAGGKGSTGTQRVMEIQPEQVHQRVPLFIGSPKEIEYVESFLK